MTKWVKTTGMWSSAQPRWARRGKAARSGSALLSSASLAEAPRQDARQSIAEHPGVRGAVAVEHARFIEEEVRGILPEGQIVIAQRGERHDNVVTRVDLQDRLRRALDPPRAGQELLQLTIGAVFRSDQADRAVGQPVRRTNVPHPLPHPTLIHTTT